MKINKHFEMYSRSYRVFHWLMGLGFVLLLMAGQQFNLNLTESYKISGLRYHSSIGFVVLVSALILITKRFIRNDTRPSPDLSKLQKIASNGAQFSLYSLAVYVPVTGLLTALFYQLPTEPFGLFNLGFMPDEELFGQIRTAHELGTYAAIVLASAHICAALHHHFIKKDYILVAMVGNIINIIPKRIAAFREHFSN